MARRMKRGYRTRARVDAGPVWQADVGAKGAVDTFTAPCKAFCRQVLHHATATGV